MSLSLVAAFGGTIPDSCNTLWEFYTGRPGSEGSAFPWATILRFIIVLFPALDVISVYPVNVSGTCSTVHIDIQYFFDLILAAEG